MSIKQNSFGICVFKSWTIHGIAPDLGADTPLSPVTLLSLYENLEKGQFYMSLSFTLQERSSHEYFPGFPSPPHALSSTQDTSFQGLTKPTA